MNVVWFKRDLRTSDHRPLLEASKQGNTIGLYVIEPKWLCSPEFSPRHLCFVHESLTDLKSSLREKNIPLVILNGDFPDVLKRLPKFQSLWSHEETGVDWTYKRDLLVKDWCKNNGINFKEFPQFGVQRGSINRDHWQQFRNSIVQRTVLPSFKANTAYFQVMEDDPFDWPKKQSQLTQSGGRKKAIETMKSFFDVRGEKYSSSLSSPLSAQEGCSRLSPYISWGNLSITEVLQALNEKKKELYFQSPKVSKTWNRSLDNFESRLWWHCHFIQKLESEPSLEFKNANRAFDGMRENDFNQEFFEAWCEGKTGFPIIDACMRSLKEIGWINFRMRAMLISFSSYQLWLHWEKPAQHLARLFLDFEPGIHYPQIQMQSGVTGINTIRIYSPEKQMLDQDPTGIFTKKWIPELIHMHEAELSKPHEVPGLLQMMMKPSTYPTPIVDPKKSYDLAKERIFMWKKTPEARDFSRIVQKKHGSRASKHFTNKK